MTSKVSLAHLPPNYPPTLFDFYLVCIYRRLLPSHQLRQVPSIPNSQGNTATPVLQGVSTADIHRYITGNEALKEDLQSRASISLIVNLPPATPAALPLTAPCPTQYAPSASEALHHYFLSAKMSYLFWLLPLQQMPENLVALTRSKGLSVLLLPTTQKFIDCSLHSILTQCAWRHGNFFTSAQPISTPKPLQITFRNRILP